MSVQMTDSRFNMWRAVTALAHADHVVDEAEKAFIMRKLEASKFSPEQQAQIEKDMVSPPDLSAVMPLVTEPADRASLVHFGRLMVWSDGTLDATEEVLVAVLRENAVNQNDIQAVVEAARSQAARRTEQIIAELKAEEAEEIRELSRPWRWLYQLLD